jgi:hypothetical protein
MSSFALSGSDTKSEITWDVAMLASEVTPVLNALRGAGLNVVRSATAPWAKG